MGIVKTQADWDQDWRNRWQDRYLSGEHLTRMTYRAAPGDWPHEFCVFCWEDFRVDENSPQTGYVTDDRYWWICEECFRELNPFFRWTVSPAPEDQAPPTP